MRLGPAVLGLAVSLALVPTARASVTPCSTEDPRFVKDNEAGPRKLPSLNPVDRAEHFMPIDYRHFGPRLGGYRVMLWEALAVGSAGGADYHVTVSEPYQWPRTIWQGSALTAHLRDDAGRVVLILVERLSDGPCNTCPSRYKVSRLRWDESGKKFSPDSGYTTRCAY